MCLLGGGGVGKIKEVKITIEENICLTSVKRAKCGIRSTLCWKTWNISGSTHLFEL